MMDKKKVNVPIAGMNRIFCMVPEQCAGAFLYAVKQGNAEKNLKSR